MSEIVIGTEAVASGALTRHELQRWYRPFFPNVHAPKRQVLTPRDRILGAWLWSSRRAVVTGLAAAAWHGSRWIDGQAPVELVHHCTRPPAGIVARNERIGIDEWSWVHGVRVATPARTAFDLGRFRRPGAAVVALDALMQATPYSIDEVATLAQRYRGARGVARVKRILPLVDGGAQSPRETWWRMFVVDAGLPRPTTQIPVLDDDGRAVRILDFGWSEFRVAFEYDGDQHQSGRFQYLKDRRVLPELRRLGWIVVSAVKEDDPARVLASLVSALTSRGWNGPNSRAETVFQQGNIEKRPA